MRNTRNINEVNVFKVWTNEQDEITSQVLIATFINKAYALDFVRNATDNDIGGRCFMDIRVNERV